MVDSKKPVESLSEVINQLDTLREQLFHIQKSLEKMEEIAQSEEKK